MSRQLLFFLTLAGLVSLTFPGCDSKEQGSAEKVEHGHGTDTSVKREDAEPPCPSSRVAWSLSSGREWEIRCYESELPRRNRLWLQHEGKIFSAGPSHCVDEPVVLSTLDGASVSELEISNLKASSLGRGASMGVFDGEFVFSTGENCSWLQTTRRLIYLTSTGVVREEERSHSSYLWSHLLPYHGMLIELQSFSSIHGILVENQLGVSLSSIGSPNKLLPLEEGESSRSNHFPRSKDLISQTNDEDIILFKSTHGVSSELGENDDPELLRYTNKGVSFSWVFQKDKGRVIFLGGLSAPMELRTEQDFRFRLFDEAWAANAYILPRRLPKPPVIGDGVTLLYDPQSMEVILFDPFSDHSFILDREDRGWIPFSHAPLPALPDTLKTTTDVEDLKIPDRRLPVTRSELLLDRAQATRFNRSEWPYYAFVEDGAIVVIQLDKGDEFCRPVEGETFVACPKSHP